MYILEPISKERIWGTPRLHDYQGEETIEKIGSVYSASGIAELDCPVVNTDASLNELIQAQPEKFGLRPGEVYPLIISFTACDENLSIQVHPTDDYAKQHENKPYGKSEAWYFITPPEEGWIYAEQLTDNKVAIQEAVKENHYQKVLQEYPTEQNDLIYIPSGTIHALTKGSLVYEIQQSTDITYRFYDYERTDKNGDKRELHVNQAIETLIPEQKVEKKSFEIGTTAQQREFTIQHLEVSGPIENSANIASVLTILSGELILADYVCTPGQSLLLMPGEEAILPGKAECVLATPIPYWW
ncbi:class I mannose-6-phosphate isomerase [Enterococcus sp. AZ109]|uniref:class I mannose-6-phosphate isomerase n=1 Tax=Enterococcus sp. AZ109 TaxID=2774634 RepID=UPI003F2970B0